LTASGISIGVVERDTGLPKDTLRMWERRYGFPNPVRDDKGERLYSAEHVERLRLLRRLVDHGVRPGAIVTESLEALKARIQALSGGSAPAEAGFLAVDDAMRIIKAHDAAGLRHLFSRELMRLGLQRFVLDVVTPLNENVGNAWMTGDIAIFEEHLYAEQIQHTLRQAITAVAHSENEPRILLTTLPGEQHQLGLLMAEACLAVEGVQCISLGTQTPVLDIALAARAHHADLVALSCSLAMPVKDARAAVTGLRGQLDSRIALWVGGGLSQKVCDGTQDVTAIPSLQDIPAALLRWRQSHDAIH
jgi:DNA-binding transcriptional MerR regulator/methanogenic corrinoid protein MtbC1